MEFLFALAPPTHQILRHVYLTNTKKHSFVQENLESHTYTHIDMHAQKRHNKTLSFHFRLIFSLITSLGVEGGPQHRENVQRLRKLFFFVCPLGIFFSLLVFKEVTVKTLPGQKPRNRDFWDHIE